MLPSESTHFLVSLPPDFPQNAPELRFSIGDRVRWQPCPTQDFGTVIGVQYAPAEHLQQWAWKYVVWLDENSPSRSWVASDSAWEADLELLAAALPSQMTQEREP